MSDAVSAHPTTGGGIAEPPEAAGRTTANETTEPEAASSGSPQTGTPASTNGSNGTASSGSRRRRGSRGGRNRNRSAATAPATNGSKPDAVDDDRVTSPREHASAPTRPEPVQAPSELVQVAPERVRAAPSEPAEPKATIAPEPEVTAAAKAEATAAAGTEEPPRPKIGDSRPAPTVDRRPAKPEPERPGAGGEASANRRRRRRGGRSRSGAGSSNGSGGSSGSGNDRRPASAGAGSTGPANSRPIEAVLVDEPSEVDAEVLDRRRGRERKGRPVGRYLMVVHAQSGATQIAVLEGRSLIEHYVSRPADDATQIDGNIYLGRVQNVLPGMEAAFVDIGTPKNAVLYRGDIRHDSDELEESPAPDNKSKPTRGRLGGRARDARIEQLLKVGQVIPCQVTKNPIGTKGARLTQEVSLPGRFVVLIPNDDTYGISKRLADDERKRLRKILDEVRPAGHGLIVRTAAEGASADELRRDVARLVWQWEQIEKLAKTTRAPALLYREPDMAVRVIREEFNRNYRGVVIDDYKLYEEIRDYVASISPELADRVEYAGDTDPLPVFERYHIHEQIHKALDRKVWLPSGGSLIIERTEALTVIDVNTGKNVGSSNLEETVFRNNLEAAEEVAHQLRLRDIGGIIVIDFIDMEIAANRAEVTKVFREALARDKTRTQVFEISDLGLVEMTRKRISEGLVESFTQLCPTCNGRGFVLDEELLPSR